MSISCRRAARGRSNYSFVDNGQVQAIHCARTRRDTRHLGGQSDFDDAASGFDPHRLVERLDGPYGDSHLGCQGNFDDTASAFEPHRKVERPERRQGDTD
jgi:hypothetical protein